MKKLLNTLYVTTEGAALSKDGENLVAEIDGVERGRVPFHMLGAVVVFGGVLVTPPLKNNSGTLLANLTGITVNVYDAVSGTLVVRKTGLSSSATGTVTISDGTLLKGNSYAYEVVTPAHGRRLPTGVAS